MKKSKKNRIAAYIIVNDIRQGLENKTIPIVELNEKLELLKNLYSPAFHIASALINIHNKSFSAALNDVNKAYKALPDSLFRKFKRNVPEKEKDIFRVKFDETVLSMYGKLLYKKSKYKDAEIVFDILKQARPTSKEYFTYLIKSLFYAGHYSQANQHIELFMKKFPDSLTRDIVLIYIRSLITLEEIGKALIVTEDFKKGLSSEDCYVLFAHIYLCTDKPSKFDVLKTASNLPNNNAEILELKGDLYSKIKMFREASLNYKRAAAITLRDGDSLMAQRLFMKAAERAMNAKDENIAMQIIEEAKKSIKDFNESLEKKFWERFKK